MERSISLNGAADTSFNSHVSSLLPTDVECLATHFAVCGLAPGLLEPSGRRAEFRTTKS